MWQSCIFSLCTQSLAFHSLYCLYITSHFCIVFVLQVCMTFPPYYLKVIHCAPSSSLMAHILTLHSVKLNTFSSFFCACSFFIAWVVMHSAQNLIPLFSPNVWSDVVHFLCVDILSWWLLFHVFGFIFTVHESLICPCSSHHRPPIPQH